MKLDKETIGEIRAILGRDCIVEVTIAFYDNTGGPDALEPVDVGTTADFEKDTPPVEQQAALDEMIESLRDVLRTLTSSRA